MKYNILEEYTPKAKSGQRQTANDKTKQRHNTIFE